MAYDAPCGGNGRYARPAPTCGTYKRYIPQQRLHDDCTSTAPAAADDDVSLEPLWLSTHEIPVRLELKRDTISVNQYIAKSADRAGSGRGSSMPACSHRGSCMPTLLESQKNGTEMLYVHEYGVAMGVWSGPSGLI
eukprot:1478048-Prymnesium_polylepis.1